MIPSAEAWESDVRGELLSVMWRVRAAEDDAKGSESSDVLGSHYSRVCGWMAKAGGLP